MSHIFVIKAAKLRLINAFSKDRKCTYRSDMDRICRPKILLRGLYWVTSLPVKHKGLMGLDARKPDNNRADQPAHPRYRFKFI